VPCTLHKKTSIQTKTKQNHSSFKRIYFTERFFFVLNKDGSLKNTTIEQKKIQIEKMRVSFTGNWKGSGDCGEFSAIIIFRSSSTEKSQSSKI
jgi:hypothetical protein